jgi:site-specific recombinase XerC
MAVYERKWLSKIEGDFFFCTRQGKRLQQRNLNHILTRIGTKVGLDWIYPHCFRRSSAQFMARKEVPILAIKEKGGWETLAMVEYYTKEITAEQLRGIYRKNSPGDAIEL